MRPSTNIVYYYAELFKSREAAAPVAGDGLGRPIVRADSRATDSPNVQRRLDGDGTDRREEESTSGSTIVREVFKAADATGGKDADRDDFTQV